MYKIYMKKTLHVGFIAGPGTGKSTIAAQTFSQLKWIGIDCELISEYAKQLVWEKSIPKLANQVYVFGKQHNKQWTLDGKVDVAISDSPLILNLYYAQSNTELKELALAESKKFRNLFVYLKRQKEYNPNGRLQSLAEAEEIDRKLLLILKEYNIPYLEIDAIEQSVPLLVDQIIDQL